MEITRIFLGGLVATSVMTGFSYLLSNLRNKQFREPELLNALLSRSPFFRLKLSKNSLAGWILHYLIGWMFVILFAVIWKEGLMPSSIISGSILGLAAGIIGVLGWRIFFAIVENPPKINWSEYYLQLIAAHVIFGICAVLVYQLF